MSDTFDEMLRKFMREKMEEIPLYRIGRKTDIGDLSLRHFMSGKSHLRSDNIGKLFDFLGLEIVKKKQ